MAVRERARRVLGARPEAAEPRRHVYPARQQRRPQRAVSAQSGRRDEVGVCVGVPEAVPLLRMRPRRALSALLLVLALVPAAPAAAEWQIVPLVGLTFHATTSDTFVIDTAAPGDSVGTHPNVGG